MAVKTHVVSVTTGSRIDSLTDTDDGSVGQSLIPYNDSALVVYFGGSDVTASGATKGVPVAAGAYGPAFDLSGGDALYATSSSGAAANVTVLEIGVG